MSLRIQSRKRGETPERKREIPVGPIKLVIPNLKDLPLHVREMIITALLLAEAKE